MSETTLGYRPDWIMCGVPGEMFGTTGVCIIASKHMTSGTLTYKTEDLLDFIVSRHFEINATTGPITVAQGKDYSEALQRLMEDWQPDSTDPQEISFQKEII